MNMEHRKTIEGELARVCGWDNAYLGYTIDTTTNRVQYCLHTYRRGDGACEQTFDTYAEAQEAFNNFCKML